VSSSPAATCPDDGFRAFFEEHVSFVLRTVRHLGAREADGLDLTQEVFAVAYEKHAELDRPDGARSWLYRICFLVVRNHQRRAQVRREIPTATPAATRTQPPAPDPVERTQQRAQLRCVLAALDEEKRAVLVAHAIEEIPMKEVAASLSIPLKTAYSRLYAAKRAAAAAYAKLEYETGGTHART
jgi:RNA polymerase sigma-70 factor (ECF subfamily)